MSTLRLSPIFQRVSLPVAWFISGCCSVGLLAPHFLQAEQTEEKRSEFLASVKSTLRTRCIECHSTEASVTEFDILNVPSLLKAGVVIAGNPDDSKLMHGLTTEDEESRMPKDLPALSAQEIEKIRRWIACGSQPFPADVTVPAENERKSAFADVSGIEYVLKQILAHQRSLPASSQRYIRYFSCNHLLTRGATREELNQQRDALVKTINQLRTRASLRRTNRWGDGLCFRAGHSQTRLAPGSDACGC